MNTDIKPVVLVFDVRTDQFIQSFNRKFDGNTYHVFGSFWFERTSDMPERTYRHTGPPPLTENYILESGWVHTDNMGSRTNEICFKNSNNNYFLIFRNIKPMPIIEIIARDVAQEDWCKFPERFRIIMPCLSVLEFDMIFNSLAKMKEQWEK